MWSVGKKVDKAIMLSFGDPNANSFHFNSWSKLNLILFSAFLFPIRAPQTTPVLHRRRSIQLARCAIELNLFVPPE